MLPSFDLSDRVRQAAFGLLLTTRRPVEPESLAASLGLERRVLDPVLDNLAAAGWIDSDETGRVTGSQGLSLTAGPHQLGIGDATFRTWCAYDSLGIAAALAADAAIETHCGECGELIEVTMEGGHPVGAERARLWLADGGADLRTDFCAPTVLLCSEAHAQAWGKSHSGQGRALTLDEGAALGGNGWAACAQAARSLTPEESAKSVLDPTTLG